MQFFKVVATAAIALAHFTAQASILEVQEYKWGYQTWLRPAETVGLSADQFNAGVGGWNQKYRLATHGEIGRLLKHLGVPEGDSGMHPGGIAGAEGFWNFVGRLDNLPAGTYFDNDANQGASAVGDGWFVTFFISSGEGSYSFGSDCPQFFSCSGLYAGTGRPAEWLSPAPAGLFVIQKVPEPGSLALMGLAGALVLYRRRKSQS